MGCKKMMFLSFFFLLQIVAFSQEKYTLSGVITDNKSNETMIGVGIYVLETKSSVNTNEYGFYSITLPKGVYTVQINYVGYKNTVEKIDFSQNLKKNFKLIEAGEVLDEVVITGEKTSSNIRSTEMSVNKLSINSIKKMPVVLGEVDVIKSLLLLPGVTNAGEGASGFNVRGGGADQNLILLDEATVFSSSHVFGFFSVFNPDAIKDLKLYKGGIPANFGGRASSVLDIYQKDGNSKKFSANGGIGLITSRLLLEGPLVKNKGSFLIAGRGSYAHLFLKLSEEQKNNTAFFYDLNTKLSYQLNPNNSLYLSGYFGRDVFALAKSFVNTYGNTTLNLRWNHLFSDKLFSNLSLIYSDYFYGLDIDLVGFSWNSGIKNYNIKYDFKNYISEKIKLNYGVNGLYYDFNPGTINPSSPNSGIVSDQLDRKYAYEPALYFSTDHKISNKLALTYGLRYSMFFRTGQSTVNIYKDNMTVTYDKERGIYEKGVPIGTEFYGSNKVIQSFDNLEPRLAASYQLNDDNSIKASYNRMVQYLQLISNTSSPTPLDIWLPSDNFIKPQIADQVALGYFKNFSNDAFSLEVETFYKEVKNRLDYIDGADLIANKAIEQVILNGQMRSYGLEVLFKKNTGNFTGWVAYTLSKSEQKTPGRTADEVGLNNGQWYNSVYDKTHNLAITGSYKKSEKWTFGANFILQTGQPATFPNGQYEYGHSFTNGKRPLVVPSYSQRNQNRLPLFHHLDISATLTPKSNKNRNWKGEWVFSIYNLYNRRNAASINFRQNVETGTNEAVRTSIFGAVPSVSYNFKF